MLLFIISNRITVSENIPTSIMTYTNKWNSFSLTSFLFPQYLLAEMMKYVVECGPLSPFYTRVPPVELINIVIGC